MIELRQYRKDDEKCFTPAEKTLRADPRYQGVWDTIIKTDWTWTAVDDETGEVLGLGGIIPEQNTVWIQVNSAAKKSAVLRAIQKGMRLAESYNFPRLFAYVQNCFDKGCLVLKRFGFRPVKTENGYTLFCRER